MIPLNTVFWATALLFGFIGALRGWAKEIMVSASVLLAMFIQQIFGQYVLGSANPYVPMLLSASQSAAVPDSYTESQLYVCAALLLVLTFFGYAGPSMIGRENGKMARERLQDALLGFFLGLLNGFLIFGLLWFYLDKSGYVVGGISGPDQGTAAWTIVHNYLVPAWLTVPMLYVAVAIVFVFAIVVFL
jgi:hypothetical protein